jgi:tetratricopeptide (TPR) repeat protein
VRLSGPQEFRIFLSAVTSEFGLARREINDDLCARGLLVKVQEQFRQEVDTETTLQKLVKYIGDCHAVVHVAGKRSGGFPGDAEAARFRHMLPDGVARASYTQWEFFIARHHKRRMSIYIAKPDFPPDKLAPTTKDEDPASQAEHVRRLETLDRDYFETTDELCRKVLREDWPVIAIRKPRNLPFSTLGSLFKGREEFLQKLHASLAQDADGEATAVVGKALHGLGGVGKTRLAVEYALRHEASYCALLFLSAETPERLNAGLAALAGPDILDLPEKDAREDEVKIPAALGWLEHHPGWLMILDNVDDAAAAAAVQKLLARLRGGRVIITGRIANFPAGVRKLELGVLDIEAAAAFLLERTADDRRVSAEDEKLARELACELGGLALGLEQAGAYIATLRIGFARYLALWKEKRATVLDWFDKGLMSYDHDTGLAATWATSVEKLTPNGRRLLDRLAFFAPEPIPETLLDVAIPSPTNQSIWKRFLGRIFARDEERMTPEAAKAGQADLYAFSLVQRASAEDGKAAVDGFTVHRLVQDFTRRVMPEEREKEALKAALNWVNAAFTGNPMDVRTWPALDPLAPHALALAARADAAGIAEPTARLYGQLDNLFDAKARYPEAEKASRRALAISETSLGPVHPKVAIRLNNLAQLLRKTNRLAEAEPLMRRALAIDEASYGPDHPEVARGLNNLAQLLQDSNCLAEAEPLMRRALAIDEASYGPDHPDVARDLNNLAALLRTTGRLAEAEPLMRRALAIFETSYGPDHPKVAVSLNNLAQLLHATNRLAEAEPLMRRALAIDEATHGPDHPKVAIRLNNLAQLLLATNRVDEAEPLMRRALAIDEASYGPDHPNVARDLNNLAQLLQDTNRVEEAEPLMRRALAIFEASYGADHPSTRGVRTNLARLARALGKAGM